MIRLDVVKEKTGVLGGWAVKRRGKGVVRSAFRKVDAVRAAAEYAMDLGAPVTVKIHLADGTIQSERTYPRGADPRRSKG